MAPPAAELNGATNGASHDVIPGRVPHGKVVPVPEGPAAIFGFGTAYPDHIIEQSTYHDKLFEMCGISDNESLKAKFKRMCDFSCITKRHSFINEDVLKEYPEFTTYFEDSLTTRVEMANKAVLEIAVEAAHNAVKEWGRPLSEITHMVFATTSVTSIPGIDLAVARKLGLHPTVQRICMYQTGCWGGGSVVRIARNLAESTKGARVLVICAEANTIMNFRKPIEDTLYKVDGFLAHVTLGDGAAALIVGADPLAGVERPIFEILWSTQMAVPDSEDAIKANMSEGGLIQQLQKDTVPKLIAKHLGELTGPGRELVGAPNYPEMFWVVHPGAYKILEVVAEVMGLEKQQLQPSWDILDNFGNMSSPTCLFVLDEMRKRSKRLGASTTGAGCDFGFLVGLGPGFNMEVSLLRSVPV